MHSLSRSCSFTVSSRFPPSRTRANPLLLLIDQPSPPPPIAPAVSQVDLEEERQTRIDRTLTPKSTASSFVSPLWAASVPLGSLPDRPTHSDPSQSTSVGPASRLRQPSSRRTRRASQPRPGLLQTWLLTCPARSSLPDGTSLPTLSDCVRSSRLTSGSCLVARGGPRSVSCTRRPTRTGSRRSSSEASLPSDGQSSSSSTRTELPTSSRKVSRLESRS